ncbi:hypothetical protein M8818_005641 [Zalaria obscura]|uniref:Uncharacterized protein n=1 Tax=Zalaria obscura TaxID=2024903 RepID=A0ACC3SAD4_9PEZI
MSLSITVPQEYGYVVVTAASTFFLGMWHGIRVGGFRKAAGVGYPCPYADSAQMSAADADKKHSMYLFNCAQRAHGNYLENQASFLAALLIAGLRYPVASSILGVGWMLGRVAYAVGYTAKDKDNGKGRLIGSHFWLCQLALFGMAATVGVKMIL